MRCFQDTGHDSAKFRTRVGHGRSGKTKGLATRIANPLISMAPRPGLEPGTYGLTGSLFTLFRLSQEVPEPYSDQQLSSIFCPESCRKVSDDLARNGNERRGIGSSRRVHLRIG